jgi:hypothetical protein
VRKRASRPAEPVYKTDDRRMLTETGPAPVAETVPSREDDPELWAVRDEFLRVPGALAAVGEAIRDAFDQAYDGQYTGRWDYRQLNKTEKTHIGTLVQINIHRYLTLDDGEELDYRVAGIEIDCKWSRLTHQWEIPEEMYLKEHGPQLALLVWGNDYTARWAVGLLRIDEAVLLPKGKQRDRKRKINDVGKSRILWLVRDGELEANQLLRAPLELRSTILGQRSGQACVNALFENMTGQVINRASVLTAAMQDDPMKRARDARKHLRNKGIVIFGPYAPHPDLADGLGLPRPVKGSFVSARLAPVDTSFPDQLRPSVEIQSRHWRLADPADPDCEAPELPEQGRERAELEPVHLSGGH